MCHFFIQFFTQYQVIINNKLLLGKLLQIIAIYQFFKSCLAACSQLWASVEGAALLTRGLLT